MKTIPVNIPEIEAIQFCPITTRLFVKPRYRPIIRIIVGVSPSEFEELLSGRLSERIRNCVKNFGIRNQ